MMLDDVPVRGEFQTDLDAFIDEVARWGNFSNQRLIFRFYAREVSQREKIIERFLRLNRPLPEPNVAMPAVRSFDIDSCWIHGLIREEITNKVINVMIVKCWAIFDTPAEAVMARLKLAESPPDL